MKHIINGIGLFAMAVIVLATAMVLSGRTVRQNEVDRALDTAVEQTVAELQEEHTYTLDNREEFLADFVEGLLIKIESDSEIEVQVAGIDYEKGLLAIKVIEHFEHMNGKPGTVESERTVLLENYNIEEVENVTIIFRVNDTDYKVYTLAKNSRIPTPAVPDVNFIGWMDENGAIVDIEYLTADSDKVFFAKMN